MNIQVFGRKKCFDTKKAERYFKERKINFQFIDIDIKGLSKGELNSVKRNISINELINQSSKEYKNLNLDKIRSNDMKEEILLKNPKLFNSPIVRNGNTATLGYKKEIWDLWE
ncbi:MULTISPECIES: arsenate reductase family protein [Clostridium]|jgi:Spx/MgsR family transcriptional regulator|uniref:Arsenate reductase family protein n=2 Tax=Clostridium tertium TaxID=1559 RepID=A0A9X3XL65_9CLOT|nr:MULTISPECIES: arsenate reductase family protein [Clostridium]EEH98107.1 spx/MgsR family transcriptional regulator [Clostridium sp. 7_2_43FAA]MBU6135651.1 arsenate reductase family protein [Clostridium tertium]MDB1947036.1 arsenate reductase family protein [Clostridium tertium]MDB1953845.1 arsenate reductase family protein [Clostridium tertium]MDB1963270.1 arsenate reductase family protein [Clostridium tertium]